MANIKVTPVQRVFIFENETFTDPNPNFTPYEVVDHLSNIHPELATAEIDEGSDIVDGVITYSIKTVISEKG